MKQRKTLGGFDLGFYMKSFALPSEEESRKRVRAREGGVLFDRRLQGRYARG